MADLDRSSLPERLAEALEEEITSGVWKDRLPGYRILCQKFKVSRPTCEAAFGILERQGILAPAEPRRTRRIIEPQSGYNRAHHQHLLVVTDSMRIKFEDLRRSIDPIMRSWKMKGGEASGVEGDLQRTKRPAFLLDRWIHDAGADFLLLHLPSKFWLRAAKETGLPCYSIGGDRTEVGDWISGHGFVLSTFLASVLSDAFQMGHRRALIPFSGMIGESAFRGTLLSQVKEKLKKYGIDDALTLSVEAPQAADPSTWHAWWPRILARVTPSLVILRGTSEAFSFHSFCLNKGIRMPEDISMVVVHETQFLGWLDPPPTRYTFPHRKAVRHFQSWVRRGFPAGYWKNYDSELVGGETLGPGPGE